MYRLGQVVYTLTQFSTVRAVLFQVEGRTVTTFGPEGIQLDGPQGRGDFEQQLPSTFVDRPAFGAAAGNPARVTGTSNVFEATFRVAILDASRKVLVDQMAMATCGSGCRGTFDVTLRYDVPKAPMGHPADVLRVGPGRQPQDIRDYPVWLTPLGVRLDAVARPTARAPAASSGSLLSSAGSVKRALSVGAWRSLVARIVRDDEVGGSNPLAPTKQPTPASGRRRGSEGRVPCIR